MHICLISYVCYCFFVIEHPECVLKYALEAIIKVLLYVAFLILYVDDILLMENNIEFLDSIKAYLNKCFSMTLENLLIY